MNKRHQRTVTALAVVTFLFGCSKSADDCNYTASCDNSGAEKNDSGNGSCKKDPDCAGTGKPYCDTTADECVQCRSNADCTNAAASVCIAGTCTGCADNADCSQIPGKSICKLTSATSGKGACVACAPANESVCGGNSCNPATNVCTNTRIGTVATCHACVADSECAAGTRPNSARCVSMNYKGSPHGSYCLSDANVVTCAQPYIITFTSPSASSATVATNCGINQDATTCEAVLNLLTPTTCTRNSTCGAGLGDGLCQNFGTGGIQNMRCTIPCTVATECEAGQTCTSTTNGYCR